MSDITLCVNDFCPMRSNCKRYRKGDGSPLQSYSYFNEENDDKCDFQLCLFPQQKRSNGQKKF